MNPKCFLHQVDETLLEEEEDVKSNEPFIPDRQEQEPHRTPWTLQEFEENSLQEICYKVVLDPELVPRNSINFALLVLPQPLCVHLHNTLVGFLDLANVLWSVTDLIIITAHYTCKRTRNNALKVKTDILSDQQQTESPLQSSVSARSQQGFLQK